MSLLYVEMLQIPAADLGEENPLSPLIPPLFKPNTLTIDKSVFKQDAQYVGYGTEVQCLPYHLQDGYNRSRKIKSFKTVVLENEILKATFLIELGGRLWSLYHKPTKQELLYKNPVFQPANLAIRNAWFSGGVEWNIGIPGHCVFTCSPLFAAKVNLYDGTPVLRMYEWERIRKVLFQIDSFLPSNSPTLFVRIRIINPNDTEIPIYWWSNIAIDHQPGTRVLVPAEEAYTFGYENIMRRVSFPSQETGDVSYAENVPYAIDYFFRVIEKKQPWIAAVKKDGIGLFQTSTRLLRGRKVFYWGNSGGAYHWQDYLSEPGQRYFEIQAGLGQTQSESVPMPAYADWSWLEAYGLLTLDPTEAHHQSWISATQAAQKKIQSVISSQTMEQLLENTKEMANSKPLEIIQTGSGWGYLENCVRKSKNTSFLLPNSCIFPEYSASREQSPWIFLLNTGSYPYQKPQNAPLSYMIDDFWFELLKQSIENQKTKHWEGWFQLGVMFYHRAEYESAKYAWEMSIKLDPSCWAYRNLALVCNIQNKYSEATDYYLKAYRIMPNLPQLAIECCQSLVQTERWNTLQEILAQMPCELLEIGRIRLCQIELEIHSKNYQKAKDLICSAIIPDVREGENTLTDLWYKIHMQMNPQLNPQNITLTYPIPQHIDFNLINNQHRQLRECLKV